MLKTNGDRIEWEHAGLRNAIARLQERSTYAVLQS